jgi:hypothetical protein
MNETSPQIIVIAGPNGAGKTTLSPFLLHDKLGVLEYVNADPIALGLSGFDPGSVAFEAGRVMLKRLHDLADYTAPSRSRPRLRPNHMLAGFMTCVVALTNSNYHFCG